MLVYALVAVAVLLWLATQLGFMASPLASVVIRVRGGQVRLARGKLTSVVLSDVADVLRDAGVLDGFITLSGGRVAFSRSIPPELHQRLRNVLLNRLR